MGYRRLLIWVEGNDDVRFFNEIIKPRLQEKYNLVEVRPYRPLKKGKVGNYLRGIKTMNAAYIYDYIYVSDINDAPCVTAKKQKIQNKLRNIDGNRIVVVIKEIESWYLAGLSNENAQKLKIHSLTTTDDITKEQFDNLIPRKFDSRIDFMSEILKYFSMKIAKQRNESLRYFVHKYDC